MLTGQKKIKLNKNSKSTEKIHSIAKILGLLEETQR